LARPGFESPCVYGFHGFFIQAHAQTLGNLDVSDQALGVDNDPQRYDSPEFGLRASSE